MALTAPRGFAGGPMSDIDYGLAASGSAWVENSADFAVTQPNTGTRTVSIAAGGAVAFGIRQPNDNPVSQALAAPSSGGAWYLISLRFNWSARTCTLQATAGPTTGGTTAPTVIPTVLPGSGYSNVAGTVFDLPLAWAFVNSANTTVTLFDLRLFRTGAGNVSAANIFGLIFANISGLVKAGALMSVQTFTLPSGGVHERSTWQRRPDGPFEPVGNILGNEGGGNVRDYLVSIATAGYSTSFRLPAADAQFVDSSGLITYRWRLYNGSYQWRPWESEWTTVTPTTNTNSGSTFPVFLIKGRWRYRAGRVKFTGQIVMNGAATFTYLSIGFESGMPTAEAGNDTAGDPNEGGVTYINDSDGRHRYHGGLFMDSGRSFVLDTYAPGNPVGYSTNISSSVPFSEQWAQSDQIRWWLEYDLA